MPGVQRAPKRPARRWSRRATRRAFPSEKVPPRSVGARAARAVRPRRQVRRAIVLPGRRRPTHPPSSAASGPPTAATARRSAIWPDNPADEAAASRSRSCGICAAISPRRRRALRRWRIEGARAPTRHSSGARRVPGHGSVSPRIAPATPPMRPIVTGDIRRLVWRCIGTGLRGPRKTPSPVATIAVEAAMTTAAPASAGPIHGRAVTPPPGVIGSTGMRCLRARDR